MRALYDAHSDVAEMANRLSRLVAPTGDTGRFVTAILGCLDPATGALQYVNAGHPPPVLVRSGEITELPGGGPPFGVLPDFAFTTDSSQMLPGDMLAVFSDGVTEAQRGEEMFDEVQLRPTLLEASRCASLAAGRDLVVQKVDSFLAGAHRSDDLTLLLMARDSAAS
jgi:serine phosphatase RsbU (regulator of sigma subunit)